jgi:hypothetical protein
MALLHTLLPAHEPLYGLDRGISVYRAYRPQLFPFPREIPLPNDDRFGRAIEPLFDTDQSSLQTRIVIQTIREFSMELERFQNSSTMMTLQGGYLLVDGRVKRSRSTFWGAFNPNREHRPDLKQLLRLRAASSDSAYPVHYRPVEGDIDDTPADCDSRERTSAR